MGDRLKEKAVNSVIWTAFDRFGQQAVQFVVTIYLARLLSPNEYALIALVMIFITLSNTLVDGGFGQALVRKQNANERDFSTIFYFNIIVSLFLYCVLYFCTPFIARFYNQPDLILVARVVFISILINSLFLIQNVKLVRKLDFRNSAIVNISSVFLSGIAGIICAYNHLGVWSLVTQQILFFLFRVILVRFVVKWRPHFVFSFKVIVDFWNYSVSLLGTSILNNIFNYVYVIVLGKYFPQKEVGLYYQANKLNETTNFSFQAILGSTYSVLVKIQDDTDRFLKFYREITRKSAIVIFPLLLFLIAVAKPMIFVLLATKWLPAVPYFQMLLVASIFNPFYTLIIAALNARGKSKVTFYIELFKKILIVISIVICLKYGIISLLVGFAVVNWLSFFVCILIFKLELTHFWKHQLMDLAPSILIGLVMYIVCWSLSLLFENQYLLLFSQLSISIAIYFLLLRMFYKELFTNTLNLISDRLNKFKT